MNHLLKLAFLTAAAAATLTLAPALLAAAKPDGLYVGTIAGTEKTLQLHVAKDGKSATAVVLCSHTKVGSFSRFPIAADRFKAVKTSGSTIVAAVSGHFLTPTKATASLNLHTLCDGHGGSLVLKLSGT